jgi:photosystem II stability/assembly factor-like uncharacterized protein
MNVRNTRAVLLLAALLLAACGGNVHPSASGCAFGEWTIIRRTDFPRTTLSVMFGDAFFGIATDLGGEISYTEDAGAGWVHAGKAGLSRVALDMAGDWIWHVGFGGALTRSIDRGRTWEYVSSLPYDGHVEYLGFADSQTGWAVTSETKLIYTTRDGGRTWGSLPLPEGMGFPSALNLRTPSEGRLLDTSGILFLTTDGGGTWSRRSIGLAEGWTIPTLNHSAAMRFTDNLHGIIALEIIGDGTGRTLTLRTEDGGLTWREETLPVPMGMFHLSRDGVFLTHVDLLDQSRITILCSNS